MVKTVNVNYARNDRLVKKCPEMGHFWQDGGIWLQCWMKKCERACSLRWFMAFWVSLLD